MANPTVQSEENVPEQAAEPAVIEPQDQVAKKSLSKLSELKNLYWHHKKWSLPASFLAIILLLIAIPWSRYSLASLALQKDYTVKIVDATTNTPVSGAVVSAANVTATTDAAGQAKLRIHVGPQKFNFSKKYYKNSNSEFTVPILSQKKINTVQLVATGRQVKISVANLISKKALSNVNIKVADITAKTDMNGSAVVVLPTGKNSYLATLSLDGFNDASVNVKLSNTSIEDNSYSLTPSGKIYYLSSLSGTLDVMKSDLDGSNAQVVLAGTGSEQNSQTQIMESSDLKYVALLTERNAANGPQIYIISTSDDKMLTVDSTNSTFKLVGWSNDYLVYSATRNDLPAWQPGLSKIKSYNASSGKTITLDQNAGSDANSNSNEVYNNVNVVADKVIYSKYWSGDQSLLSGKQNTVQLIEADGTNHKTVANYDASNYIQQLYQHDPDSFYIAVSPYASSSTTYYDYSIGGSLKQVSPNNGQLYANNTYYLSPSGNEAFWSEVRNGKNSLIVSDSTGANQTTIVSLSDYAAAGWYSDQYLLVTDSASGLYIMSVGGGTPVKITNYQATNIY